MRIAVVGTRGMPGVHGGVERHCEELYPRVVRVGCEVRVYARTRYVPRSGTFDGVQVESLPAPVGRGAEALVHTARAMRQAARDGCDILHVHSVGPSALVPYARMLGHERIVCTIHAPDYLQRKWGPAGRAFLRFGEWAGVRGASAVICVSEWYGRELSQRYRRPVDVIPNGPGLTGFVPKPPSRVLGTDDPTEGYVLFVGRLIPDKRVEDLISAAGREPRLAVVVAGDASDSEGYAAMLRELAGDNVRFVGYVYGQDLADLYGGAMVVALPSSVEGLPISALEAMAFGVPTVLSDIPAHREVSDEGRAGWLYPCGEVAPLRDALDAAGEPTRRAELVGKAAERVRDAYNWETIAARTVAVYERIIRP